MKHDHSIYQEIIFLVGMALIAYTLIGCSVDKVTMEIPESSEVILVKTAQVLQRHMAIPIRASGRVSSKAEIKLSFKIGGIVQKIMVEEGGAVRKGQIMAQLDLSEINAKVKQAESAYKKAERDYNRVKSLYDDKVATLEQMEDSKTAVEITRSQLRIAEFNCKHATIYAPSDGKVLKRFVEKNELVSPGLPVLIFGASDKDWVVRVGVTDMDVVQLKIGDKATVNFDAYPNKIFSAKISEIAEVANPTSGTFEVELKVNSRGIKLVSGFIAKLDIEPSKTYDFWMIPVNALVEGEKDKGFVFIHQRDNNTVKKIPVTIGYVFDDQFAVSEGLENVTEVITEGAPYLKDGSKIRISPLDV